MLQLDHSKLNSTHLLVLIIVPHSALRTPISPLVSISFWWRLSVSVTCQTDFTRRWRRGPVFSHIWPGECVREVMRTADSRCQGRRTHLTPSHARPERSSRWQWVTENRSEPGPEQELTGSDRRRHWGPGQELTQWTQTSFFRYQVFFDNDPSSSTSLLSSVDITTRS